MCGIIGIASQRSVCEDLLGGLARLEYRGYDSAGIAVWSDRGIERVRSPGKLTALRGALLKTPIDGTLGIGHTRWATHGAATETNAHPHAGEEVAVVHNGIFENFQSLREELLAKGYVFYTETDTEVVVYLVEEGLRGGLSPLEAVRAGVQKLKGAFCVVFLFKAHGDLLIGVRQGAPLVVGYGNGAMFFGSDAAAFASLARQVTYLEDGDIAVLSPHTVRFYNAEGQSVERPVSTIDPTAFLVHKGNYRHFMHKEIHEQPEVLGHALGDWIDFSTQSLLDPYSDFFRFDQLERLMMTGCGTAFYAALTARYWFERYARLPVDVDLASEFRYRDPPLPSNGLTLAISQSGETADTLAALRHCKAHQQRVVALTNVPHSTLSHEADCTLRLCAGPEIGVASTKAFVCQLAVLACLSVLAGRERGVLSPAEISHLLADLLETPRLVGMLLLKEPLLVEIARALSGHRHVFYIGRGTSYPLALEGALKLKELSYIHAEGYAAGELKHGAIALMDEEMPVVVVAPRDLWFSKTISNMEEVLARNVKVVLIADGQTLASYRSRIWHGVEMPRVGEISSPIVYTVPLQLLAYHTAVHLGTDVDQPRNLAKAVTVE